MDTHPNRLLSDEAWRTPEVAFVACQPSRGRPAFCNRRFVNAVLWVLRTGAPWRDLPATFGPWQTTDRRFARWAKAARWQRFWQLLAQVVPHTKRAPACVCIDSTSIRVHAHGAPPRKSAAKEHVGQSRRGKTTKLHLACVALRGQGFRTQRALLSPGHRHDLCAAMALVAGAGNAPASDARPSGVADKAYDARWLRQSLHAMMHPVIPSRRNRLPWSSWHARRYEDRHIVERAFARISEQEPRWYRKTGL